jgi:hypothetical protein
MYGLETPNLFVNFSKSHGFYCVYGNAFSEKESVGFTRLSQGFKTQKVENLF